MKIGLLAIIESWATIFGIILIWSAVSQGFSLWATIPLSILIGLSLGTAHQSICEFYQFLNNGFRS